jgi:putative transposase
VADPTRVVREQFLVEVADTTAADLAEQHLTHSVALLELNRLFTAWVETVYHQHIHSETGQTPLQRWDDGWQAAGHGPVMASADALTEAFQWSELRKVTKTATVSLHGNTYQVEAVLVGCKVELVFSPFDLQRIDVHYRGCHYGRAVPFRITRHAHPKARPETPEPAAAPNTGIAYLKLVADAHQQQIAADERIGFHALYNAPTTPAQPTPDDARPLGQLPEQLPGQLSIDDALTGTDETDGQTDTATAVTA